MVSVMSRARGVVLALCLTASVAHAYESHDPCEVTVNQQTGEVIIDAYGVPGPYGLGNTVTMQLTRLSFPTQDIPGAGYYTALGSTDWIDADGHARITFHLPGYVGFYRVDVTPYADGFCRTNRGRACAHFMLGTNVCTIADCTPNAR